MINNPRLSLEYWFVVRPKSERRLIFLLVMIGIPALFYLLLWRPLNSYTIMLDGQIKEAKMRYQQWMVQVESLKKISNDPRVLQWKREQEIFEKNKKNLSNVLNGSNTFLHEELLSLLFQQQNSIQLEKINYGKMDLSAPFQYTIPLGIRILSLDLSGEYFDFVRYLERLENAWPSLKINNITYQVVDYPRANIQLELAVLYAKKSQ